MLIMDCEVTSDMKWDEFTTSCDIRKWSGFVVVCHFIKERLNKLLFHN